MHFNVKRDMLLKSLSLVQGIVEKKNTLPILSNVLLQLKNNKNVNMNNKGYFMNLVPICSQTIY